MHPITFSPDELNRLWQWFDTIEDLYPGWWGPLDYELARRLYQALEMRMPGSLRNTRKRRESEES